MGYKKIGLIFLTQYYPYHLFPPSGIMIRSVKNRKFGLEIFVVKKSRQKNRTVAPRAIPIWIIDVPPLM